MLLVPPKTRSHEAVTHEAPVCKKQLKNTCAASSRPCAVRFACSVEARSGGCWRRIPPQRGRHLHSVHGRLHEPYRFEDGCYRERLQTSRTGIRWMRPLIQVPLKARTTRGASAERCGAAGLELGCSRELLAAKVWSGSISYTLPPPAHGMAISSREHTHTHTAP